jgi:hypothetical protein
MTLASLSLGVSGSGRERAYLEPRRSEPLPLADASSRTGPPDIFAVVRTNVGDRTDEFVAHGLLCGLA